MPNHLRPGIWGICPGQRVVLPIALRLLTSIGHRKPCRPAQIPQIPLITLPGDLPSQRRPGAREPRAVRVRARGNAITRKQLVWGFCTVCGKSDYLTMPANKCLRCRLLPDPEMHSIPPPNDRSELSELTPVGSAGRSAPCGARKCIEIL